MLTGALLTGCSTGNPFSRQPIATSLDSSGNASSLVSSNVNQKDTEENSNRLWPKTSWPKTSRDPKSPVQLAGFKQDGDTPQTGLISSSVERNEFASQSSKNQTTEKSLQPAFESASDGSLDSDAQNASPSSISLAQVLDSVAECYPEIEIAIGEIEAANGKVLTSWGEFDRVFAGHSVSQPLGFYQNYRNGIGLTQPLYGGGEVYGIYRIGDGDFEPWYGDRETNEGGELKAGFSLPFLKDRSFDERRAKLLASGAQRDQIQSNTESRLLQFQRFATQAYWDWVASGQAVQIQRQLVQLAEKRVSQIKARVESGDLAEIAQIDNDRLIAKRKNDLIKARRLLEKSAIKLSMFWRDFSCDPVIADETLLPNTFPGSNSIASAQLQSDIETAVSVRPELTELQAMRREACIDLRYAENLTMPKLDLKGFAGQDIGGAASRKEDKTPFQLQVGVFYEVPIERRKGLGKIQSANGKLTQIDAKIRFTTDKIRAELQDSSSAVNAAFEQIQQSSENLRLTKKSLELGLIAFEEGDIDLITLNIYETAVATAELQLLDGQFKYFYYRAVYETAKTGLAFDR